MAALMCTGLRRITHLRGLFPIVAALRSFLRQQHVHTSQPSAYYSVSHSIVSQYRRALSACGTNYAIYWCFSIATGTGRCIFLRRYSCNTWEYTAH